MAEEEAIVEVLDIPEEVDDDFLQLYFENKRRSGGGNVASLKRRGDRAWLVFEDSEVAEQVISKTHVLQNTTLTVRKPPPMDQGKLVLRGLRPHTSHDHVELYVSNITGLDPESDFGLYFSPSQDLVLVHLQSALSKDFPTLSANVSRKKLNGVAVCLEQVEATDSVLVSGVSPGLSQDMLELYFGLDVLSVSMLKEGCAKVTFQDVKSVDLVLQVKSHKLQDGDLTVMPYYDFLVPAPVEDAPIDASTAPDPAPTPGLDSAALVDSFISLPDATKRHLLSASGFVENLAQTECSLTLTSDGVGISGPDALAVARTKSDVLQFLTGFAQEHVTYGELKTAFLRRADVKEKLDVALSLIPAAYDLSDHSLTLTSTSAGGVARAKDLIEAHSTELSVPVSAQQLPRLVSRDWTHFLSSLELCCARADDTGQSVHAVTLSGTERHQQEKIRQFLEAGPCEEAGPLQKESVLTMEPGVLTFLQLHHRSLLEDLSVVLLPLETGDGLIIQGDSLTCQTAEEVLRSVIDSVFSKSLVVSTPGISRFLLEEDGARFLAEMTHKFQVFISLEKVHWEALDNADIFDLAWNMTPIRNFSRSSHAALAHGATAGIQEAKQILSDLGSGVVADAGLSLYPEGERLDGACSLEEDASVLLAIQMSMEDGEKGDDLQKALELSDGVPLEDSTQLEQAMDISLQDSVEASGSAEILVFANYSHDLIRVEIALKKKASSQQSEEKLEHNLLSRLSCHQRRCVELIKRKHAVEITLQGTTATLSGFKQYVCQALADLKGFLQRAEPTMSDGQIARTVQWVWSEQSSAPATPYPPDASVFIENAWMMKRKTMDILFNSQPYSINFEKMEELSLASGKSVRVKRQMLSSGDDLYTDGAGDCSLLSRMPELTGVDEDSEEFQEVVKDFYYTLQDKHSKIRVVKVEKLVNKLLQEQYRLKKASVMLSSSEATVERTLYHGTAEASVKEICIHGFNRSFCGKNATAYGQGVYFAVNSVLSASDTYSPPNMNGHKFVFVAKVLTGDFTVGTRDMKTAPLVENSSDPIRFHSVTDKISSPTLFVIFNDTQAYPEYLITCEKIPRRG